MKIVVSVNNNTGLDAELDPRFGRADYFAIFETGTEEVDFINNAAKNAASGAGIQAVQTVADQGVNAVISGNIGPKAYDALQAADIKVYVSASGTLKDVIKTYEAGELDEVSGPTNAGHAGLR
ncbi:MAG: NifB/NifX family molybdenum-iron cluster-binding protein [Halanaerobium sp.]